jgi:hypothetical protein
MIQPVISVERVFSDRRDTIMTIAMRRGSLRYHLFVIVQLDLMEFLHSCAILKASGLMSELTCTAATLVFWPNTLVGFVSLNAENMS